MKTQKGITLVALVITIIVLLILAVVAIGAVRDSGIIGHAQNSADKYNSAKLEEESMIGQYEDAISQYETNGSFETEGEGPGDDLKDDEVDSNYDYDAIAQIFTKAANGEITTEQVVQQMKEELEIDDENITDIFDLMIPIEVLNNKIYSYVCKINALYEMDLNTKTVSYVEKTGNEEAYTLGRNIKKVKDELERIFVGKSVSEIMEQCNAGTLDDYVANNSEKITIDGYEKFGTNENDIGIYQVTFVDGNTNIILEDYSIDIYQNGEIYNKVTISYGN